MNLEKGKEEAIYMSLSAFLNPVKVENKKVVISDRFVENGKPVPWEIKIITEEEEEAIRKSCTIKEKGKNGITTREFDESLFSLKLVAACVVYPNLKDVELQQAYHAMGETDLLKKMLTSGEYWRLTNIVQKFNGFDKSLDDMVDEVKN